MDNMYSIIQALCEKKGITITEMCREAGVPRSSMGNLATGSTQQLSAKNIQKVAEYFNVSTDYLLGKEEKPTDKGELQNDEIYVLTRRAKKLPPEDYKKLVKNIEDTVDLYLQARGIDPND